MKIVLVLMCAITAVFCQRFQVSRNTEDNRPIDKREIIVIKTGQEDPLYRESDDDTLLYATYVAKRLNKIENVKQRWLCEHLIETSIHKAFLGELSDRSEIVEYGEITDNKRKNPSPQGQVPNYEEEQETGPLPFLSDAKSGMPPEQRRKIREIHTACQDNPNTFVNESQLRKLRNNKDNKQIQVHMFCMAERIGIVKNDGQFDKEIIKSSTSFLFKSNEALNEMYKKCAVLKRTKEETITYFWLCLIAHSEYYRSL